MAVFLLPLAKGLLSAGAKAGAKKALMNKAKSVASNKAKKFLKNKKSNKKTRSTSSEKSTTSKGGALVKAMNGGGVTAMRKSSSVKVKNPNLSAKGSKIGFQKINIQLDNINKLTGSIDDALKGQYQKEVQERKSRREAAAKLRKSRREQLLEGGKKAAGVASGVVSGVGGAFDFMGFITNILLGGLLLFLVKSFKKIISAFNFVRDNLYLVFASLRAILQAFRLAGSGLKAFVRGAIKAPLKIIKAGFKGFFRLFSSILRKGGSLIGAGLRGLGNALFDFGAAAIKRIKDLAVVAGRGLVRGAKAARDLANFLRKTAPLTKLRSAAGKLFQKALATPAARLASKISYTRLGNKAAELIFDARLGIRSAKKALAPVLSTGKDLLKAGAAGGRKLITEGGELLVRGADKGRRAASALKGKVSPFLKKLLGSKGAQEVAGAAPFLKRLKGPLSKIKIPIIGPLLVLGINLLDPDVGVEESIFKALGTAVGEIIGTLVPIPILGTLIGGLLGEYGGSLLYTLIRGGGIGPFQKRISEDFKKLIDVGKQGWEFISGGTKRLIDNFPEIKVPKKLGLQTTLGLMFPLVGPLQGKRLGARIETLPDLGAFFNMDKMGSLMKGSFFPDKFDMPKFKSAEPNLDDLTEEEQAMIDTMPTKTSTPTTPLVGEVKDPKETDGQSAPKATPTTGTGLKDVVPTANLMARGVGTGDVGMTSGRGMRMSPTLGRMKHHAGVDIGTNGEKGYFVAFKLKGKVSLISNLSGYGETVIIEAGGYDFLFAHLARRSTLTQGQPYNGEIIGEIGNTGVGTGEHLHFEVRSVGGGSGTDVDPMPFVKHLVIGRMGDGSAVGTQTAPSTTFSQVTESVIRPASPGSSAPAASRNLEQYPSYDDAQRNIIVMGQGGRRGGGGSLPSRGGGTTMRTGASTTDMLNSYYKQQLLGLLYKVG